MFPGTSKKSNGPVWIILIIYSSLYLLKPYEEAGSVQSMKPRITIRHGIVRFMSRCLNTRSDHIVLTLNARHQN